MKTRSSRRGRVLITELGSSRSPGSCQITAPCTLPHRIRYCNYVKTFADQEMPLERLRWGQSRALEQKRVAEITYLSYVVLPQQVDKGVVPLAGTNGETTTQGENCLASCPTDHHAVGAPLGAQGKWEPPAPSSAMLTSAFPLQGWMDCLSAAPSTRRMELTLPSGAVC